MDLINNGKICLPTLHADPVVSIDMCRYVLDKYIKSQRIYPDVYIYVNQKYFNMEYKF